MYIKTIVFLLFALTVPPAAAADEQLPDSCLLEQHSVELVDARRQFAGVSRILASGKYDGMCYVTAVFHEGKSNEYCRYFYATPHRCKQLKK